MIIHVAHLDPRNGAQSIIHAATREALDEQIIAWLRQEPTSIPADLPDDEVIEYHHNEGGEDYFYVDEIDIQPAEKVWDYSEVETALCIYEAATNVWHGQFYDTDKQEPTPDAPEWVSAMDRAWNDNGSFGMKHAIAHLAFEVQQIWNALDGPDRLGMDGIVFDWEFIPEVLPLVDWDSIDVHQIGKMKPEALEALTAWRDAEKARQSEASFLAFYPDLDAYKAALEKAAGRRWGYPQLITEEGVDSVIAGAFEARTKPEDFVEEQGKEHELMEPDPITMQDLARIYR